MADGRIWKQWTDKELGVLQDHPDWPVRRIAEELGRSEAAVRFQRSKVRSGWVPQFSVWAEDEDRIIRDTKHINPAEVARLLPGRSVDAVSRRRKVIAAVHGIRFSPNYNPLHVGGRPLLARTCPDCGLLLQAFWFESNESRKAASKWRRKCSRCRHEPHKKNITKAQAAKFKAARESVLQRLRDNAHRSGQPWTEADFGTLSDPDLSITEKAVLLHRSWDGTAKACKRRGLSSKRGLGDPERDQWSLDNPNADRIDEITASLKVAVVEAPEHIDERTAPSWDWDDVDLRAS